jgi:hypothetical protein
MNPIETMTSQATRTNIFFMVNEGVSSGSLGTRLLLDPSIRNRMKAFNWVVGPTEEISINRTKIKSRMDGARMIISSGVKMGLVLRVLRLPLA